MTDARIAALRPLADIADTFENDGLDEARPSWGDDRQNAKGVILVLGRGGKTLLTLEQCFAARDAMRARPADVFNTKPRPRRDKE